MTTIMKTSLWIAIALVAGCSKKGSGSGSSSSSGGGDDVVKQVGDLENAMCVCADEACAARVRDQVKKLDSSGAMKKPTDEQMSTVMKAMHHIDECEHKFVLDDIGKKRLEQMKTTLADTRAKVAAGKYTEASFQCSPLDLQTFEKTYGAYANSKPDVKALLDDYRAYCTVGVHIEAATKAVEQAEAARAAQPKGHLSQCTSADMTLAEVKLKDAPDGLQKLAPLKERMAKVCAP